jgi:hypothetical protein
MPTVGRQGARRPGNLDKAGPPPYTSPVTRIFLLAAVLFAALPQGVVAASDDGGDPPGKAAGRARRLVENLPLEAKAELRRLYRKYAEAVGNRLEQGWRPGLLDEAAIAGEGDGEEPFKPARLVEDMMAARRREIRELEDTLKRTSPDKELPHYNRTRRAINEKTAELRALREKAMREKGLSRDWSDMVWHELNALEPSHWSARDEVRRTRPFHTGAVLCAVEGEVCLVFDPWAEGKAEVFAFEAWNEGRPGGRFPRDYMLYGLPEKAP